MSTFQWPAGFQPSFRAEFQEWFKEDTIGVRTSNEGDNAARLLPESASSSSIGGFSWHL